MFPFLFYWSQLKVFTVHSRNSSLFCERSIIGQLNISAATAEIEEQYTYGNIIYIGFQNSYSFFEVFFDNQLFLKGRQINLKILVVEFIFWQSCRSRSCNFTKKAILTYFQRVSHRFVIFQYFLTLWELLFPRTIFRCRF